MIIRSAVAGGIDGILYPRRGVAALGPLVIKASVGTLFRAPLIHCDQLPAALTTLQGAGYAVASLEGGAPLSVFDYVADTATVFILGGETDGVSPSVSQLANYRMAIPMAGGVESLNVAVAGSLIAYARRLSSIKS
jgi:23S rRNA (guanosine2251-2'-O)-methyltransferase